MKEEKYVSFETAKLLKEKGFNSEKCTSFYEISPEDGMLRVCGCDSHDNTRYAFEYSRPTIQEAKKWCKENHIESAQIDAF